LIRYYITNRLALPGESALLRNIERLADSIDYLQIREKDLTARELAHLVRDILRVRHPLVRVLVNGCAGIAIATGADGVHLRGNAISPARLRRILPRGFEISVACHSLEDVRAAAREGADMALLAPIFAVPGKAPPLGLHALRTAAEQAEIPVIALGGITPRRIPACLEAGAAGVAGITLYQDPWQPSSS
jgi:thiamine-phosphate pyrophosphorylase